LASNRNDVLRQSVEGFVADVDVFAGAAALVMVAFRSPPLKLEATQGVAGTIESLCLL
jgi:hypothetical protein